MYDKYICSVPSCPTLDTDDSVRCKCIDPARFKECPLGVKNITWRLNEKYKEGK